MLASIQTQIYDLLQSDLPSQHTTADHPLLPHIRSIKLTPLAEAEQARVASELPLSAIDTSRYEELDAPESADHKSPEYLAQWKDTLRKAYASSTYLQSRLINLSLLEAYGKNAYLISNSQLESMLRSLEAELASTQAEVEQVNKSRKQVQEDVRGEMEGLEQSWKTGVGRVVEVEVAGEEVRAQILNERRRGGQ